MATLPTNYTNDILDSSVTTRQYNLINNPNGTISLTDATPYASMGSDFGADDINATNTQVNANTTALGGNRFYWGEDGKPYISDGVHDPKKLGSSDGSATTEQVLEGTTFGSANYDDTATGTMKNNGAISKTITGSGSDQSYTIPKGYHNGSGKVLVKGVSLTGFTPEEVLASKKVTIESNGTTVSSVTGTMTNRGSWTSTPTGSGRTTIPKGYHDGTGYVDTATCYSNAYNKGVTDNLVKKLGSASSYNIKALYPDIYASLTTSNFLVVVNSVSASSSTSVSVDANGYSYGKSGTITSASSGSITPTVSYSNGTLTISNTTGSGSGSYNDKNGDGKGMSASESLNASISYTVYMVVGTIK